MITFNKLPPLLTVTLSGLCFISFLTLANEGNGKTCVSDVEFSNTDACFEVVNILDDEDASADDGQIKEKDSPWIASPMLSSDPKMGSSLGALAGYLHKFDEKSPASMFGFYGAYSDTKSYYYGAFARANYDEDHQRISGSIFSGIVKNDYEDYLGSGLLVKTEDEIEMAVMQYLYRVSGNWFVGGLGIVMDYKVVGRDKGSQEIIDKIGLTGFKSNALGFTVKYDSRNNINSPSSGSEFTVLNTAFRESFGGDESFDAYTVKYRNYFEHGDGHVLAIRTDGRWTHDAPQSGYSSINLRGYVKGNYLAKHMSVIELEERYRLTERWALAGFTGTACLYESTSDCSKSKNWYSNAGFGVLFTMKQEEKMVIRADLAWGEGDNSGFYLNFGQPF